MNGFHPRRRQVAVSVTGLIVLAVLWAMLWGDPHPGTIAAGVLIGAVTVFLLPMPRIGFHGRLHPWGAFVLLVKFHIDLVQASWQVSKLAFRFGYTPRGGIIGVKLRRANDLTMTSVAQISALVPGTIVVDAHRLTGTLYLHVLDLDLAGGAEQVRQDTLELEARVLRALAPREELERLGLVRARRRDTGKKEVSQ
ncbi:multisubunit sodium/proton antiporter, MrpE subunit (TC 2.A.63.1) [Micrococcales bacterium KH10]|nr:multisubunit sodium/proton antiporter, MrpE subunit (TC 2.A.63.1) [Micrococcales bacterium KH10]